MEQQSMALTSKGRRGGGMLVAGSSSRANCQQRQRRHSMLVLREPHEAKRISDTAIRSLVETRFTQLASEAWYDWQRHGYIIVLEPGDIASEVEAESGCPVVHDVFGEIAG